ncbi:hypothetical protein BT96DRAFT_969851 [Gymnopus androsaceus JB14]|uniref:DH domain-containing protein n=1 Tax=Gymnopus androsaceus JB14 TaxID=1447944 RepID=A0A6A4II50_9AGAR|nr:hypothetical protein BT96DRAFT_969851 [Gymnopus androsaceus JB14]
MALANSPRKQVPLATGDETRPRDFVSAPSTTKRVFFCGVVVEGSENGKELSDGTYSICSHQIKELVLSLGVVVEDVILPERVGRCTRETDHPNTRKRALTESSALASAINELVTTERSYVKKLQTLKSDYADPLRKFAGSKSTAIIPKYEAKTLFGNLDNLLPVNEAFLTDLEKMMAPNGSRTVGGIGDVALRHFKELTGFEQYKQYYVKREEAQLIFNREVAKRSSPFAAYIDRIKYQSVDRNRVGLRELLMEPVQRIPRYTLLFRLMIKHMSPGDPQRAKLETAEKIASSIAQAEADEQTQRATILHSLISTIEGFPPEMFSNSRRFIDCIDVEDILLDAPTSSAASSSSLHKLLIAKRPGNGEKSGRALSGLDELDKLTKGLLTGKKKSGMVFKGVLDVTDVVATDQGGADFHLYLEKPPQDQSERWSGRPFRSLSVVHPPSPVNLDPTQTEADKQRFLENLWNVQAKYRARLGQSVVLRSDDTEVESRSGKVTVARTYYNVYQRTAFLQETKKTKIVVHVDAMGTADDIPFGITGPPFAVIRIQPLAGGVCRFKVTSSDPSDPEDEDVVQTTRVPSRIVLTIHQFGLFQFKTDKNSRPSTPTARSKASIFGLDAISRNLFNSRPGSSMGDFFAGSVNGRKRTKSTASRSSTYTQTTSTGDSSFTKFSSRSNTISTVATTVDDGSLASSRSKTKHDRGRSPGPTSDVEGSLRRSLSRSLSRSISRTSKSRSMSQDRDSDYTDIDDDHIQDLDRSDQDLAQQLELADELARRNSKSQNDRQVPVRSSHRKAAPIYEEEPLPPARPSSRASTARDSSSQCTVTEDPRSPRALSQNSSDRRPMGPRSPSPLPPSKSPRPASPPLPELPSMDDELADQLTNIVQPTPTRLPRSKRQIFQPVNNIDSTPKSHTNGMARPSSFVEPLSIKKKTSVRSTTDSGDTPVNVRRSGRTSLSRTPAKIAASSPRRVSPQIRLGKVPGPSVSSPHMVSDLDKIVTLARTTKEDIESSHRAVKRMKVEVERQGSVGLPSDNDISRPSSPSKGFRTPQRGAPPLTKAAQDRLDEMRSLISQRTGESTPRSHRPPSVAAVVTPLRQHSSMDSPGMFSSSSQPASGTLDRLVAEADSSLAAAVHNHDAMQTALGKLSSAFRERTNDLERSRIELQNSRRQCEVVKSLLEESTKEKEIMYEAFNEELDAMYNDVNLPDDEAWRAMTEDLRVTKESRNKLSQENCDLRQRLAEAELRQEEWGALLRAHGLIP